ncbi:MAG: ATP-grasp domain-containing protein [Actinomycetota bacterium]|nr:ATP-grasp domain-containing protein [Actinomycetota bacterium]
MRVVLVITDQPWYEPTGYADAWVRALRSEGADVERLASLPPRWAVDGPPRDVDLVIPHVLVEEVASFAVTMQLAGVLECSGARLLNPLRALVTSSDKLATAAVWAAAGIPQPRTWDLAGVEEWPSPGRPLVLKPALCDGARHICLVRDLASARDVVASWRKDEAAGGERRGAALLQEWVEEPACVRIFATPERTSLAYEKNRDPGALVTSGTVYPRVYGPPAEMAEIARAMVSTLGGGLMGVDVLVDGHGRCLALEANAPFGFDVTDPEQGRFVARAALDHGARLGVTP